MVPFITSRHTVTLHCTSVTFLLSELLAEDSLKIARERGYPEVYDRGDVATMRTSHDEVRFGDTTEFRSFEVLAHTAGHIPGATMWEVNQDKRTVFTGDLHTLTMNLVGGARPVPCDNLVIESTYAGREHPDRPKLELDFLSRIEEVLDRGGKVVVPAFAIGRTQEVLMVLAKQQYDVWLDGMGKEVTKTYLRNPEYLKDPKSAVFLTGYQVAGTNGRRLMDHGMVEFKGEKRKVECEVGWFDFSAHAGHSELLKFIRECDPSKVVLMHGDNREALAKELEGEREVVMPKPDVEFEL